MSKQKTTENRPFQPPPRMAAQLTTNRNGRLTTNQRNLIWFAGLGSAAGFACMLVWVVSTGIAASGITPNGIVTIGFFIFFMLSFGYLLLTLYFNASWFVPDAFSKNTVQQSRGKLKIRMAARERQELPFSYIVGDYSFAPFVVPPEVPLDEGREYIVYYAAHSRIFLGIEPVNYASDE